MNDNTPASQLDNVALDSFSLAVRVMVHAFEIDAPAAEFEKPWELLREIADGSATVTSTAELAARFPNMKDFLYDRVNSIIENDRETARRVLRGLTAAY
ncbi:MAG TPA: hypothetical protein VK929_00915 [Longimicrobiales bacterium]|nr:hypothetical protein [Longimicrobiales bacterium]